MDSNEVEKKNHVFTWKIKNYSMCSMKRGEYFVSSTFKARSFNETTWYLRLYPRGNDLSDDGYISCYLKREDDDVVAFEIECDFIIEAIDQNGRAVQSMTAKKHKFEKGTTFGWRNYMKANEVVKTALFDDTLIIQCRLCKNLPEKISYSQNTSTTKFKTSTHSFLWVVKNFKSVTRKEIIKLPCSGSTEVEVTIKIPKDDVEICILIDGNDTYHHFVLCNFMLLDVDGKERDSKRATHLFENSKTWEFPTFISKSQLYAEREVYLKDGCFTLQCDITVSDGSIATDDEKKNDLPIANKLTISAEDTLAVLNMDIKRMYEDKIRADLILKVGEEVFFAHESILCARSPVFMAMFDNDMTENQTGEVEISDLDAETVDLFLEYIYTETLDDLDHEIALKLIVAAEKYQVLSLKNKCADLLVNLLSDENVCEILVTADLVQHDALKASVLKYIKMQPKKIFNSEKWKHCVKNNFLLATETVSEVAILLGDQAK